MLGQPINDHVEAAVWNIFKSFVGTYIVIMGVYLVVEFWPLIIPTIQLIRPG